MRVGIICEGSTDFVVLEAIAGAIIDAKECRLLQPDFDLLRNRGTEHGIGPGWQGVRKFLKENAVALSLPVYDVILIQVDASIRHLDEVKRHLKRSRANITEELQPLFEHVAGWAGSELPDSAIITLPREDIEAWILAAHSKRRSVEGIREPATVLVTLGILTENGGKPHKTEHRYKQLARAVVRLAKDRRKLREVPELERTVNALTNRARVVRSTKSTQR